MVEDTLMEKWELLIPAPQLSNMGSTIMFQKSLSCPSSRGHIHPLCMEANRSLQRGGAMSD